MIADKSSRVLAVIVAEYISSQMHYAGGYTQHQAEFLFDRLVDILELETPEQLIELLPNTGAGGHYD